jgi:DNA-binding transcriptional MerR regulator
MTIPTDRLLDLANRRLRTGEVAQRAGVNVQTLRYYERRGLIAAPARSPGGHRTYPSDTVTLVTVIKVAQRLGFTLDEVADLLARTVRFRSPTWPTSPSSPTWPTCPKENSRDRSGPPRECHQSAPAQQGGRGDRCGGLRGLLRAPAADRRWTVDQRRGSPGQEPDARRRRAAAGRGRRDVVAASPPD